MRAKYQHLPQRRSVSAAGAHRGDRYACPNGSAARGIPAVDNEICCVSCDEHYRPEGTKCVPRVYERILGLAAIGNTLYMRSWKSRLYTLDSATGAATLVGLAEVAP